MRLLLTLLLICCLGTHPAYALGGVAAQITNISDFNLPNWGIGDPALSASMDICIYAINVVPVGSYAITVTSSNGSYVLKKGTQTIPYSLYWNDGGVGNLSSSAGTQLSDGVKLSNRANANILSTSCAAGLNARLTIKITQAAMTAALAGTYTDTITLLLSPD